MSGAHRAMALARKDLQIEWRGRATITLMGTFAALLVLLLGFALDSSPQRAATILWVAMGLAATVGVARPTHAELDDDALETLLLYPGNREDVFWGKWGALLLILCMLLGFLLLLLAVLFNINLWHQLPALIGVGLLGAVGLASVGTLFAGLTLHVRGSELLMPVLLLPVAMPVVLAGIRLTEAILGAGPWATWLAVLGAFDLVFLLLAPIMFSIVIEDV